MVSAALLNRPVLPVTMYFEAPAPLIVPAVPMFKSKVLNERFPLVSVSVPVSDCTLLLSVTPAELLMVRLAMDAAAPIAVPAA